MPTDLVVDASAAVRIGLGGSRAEALVERIVQGDMHAHATELMDLEAGSAFRRYVLASDMTTARAQQALDLIWNALPVRRHPVSDLLPRAWQLQHRCSFYDATYVALAEALSAKLLTEDARLARGVGDLVDVELWAPSV